MQFFAVRWLSHISSATQHYAEVWLVHVELLRSNRLERAELLVMLQHDFPLSLPKIVLHHPPIRHFGYPPNVGTYGHICTFNTSTTVVNPDAPGEIVEACVRQAITILEREATETGKEYEAEFIAHWEGYYAPEPALDFGVLSLITEEAPQFDAVTYVRFRRKLGMYI